MKIVIFGSGNVATHIAKKLAKTEYKIIQIISKRLINAKKLANTINCSYSNEINNIVDADLYILSVKDDVISDIVLHKKLQNKFIVHTSGSVPLTALSRNTKHYGVFYPLQTFNKNSEVNFSDIPLCIEASGEKEYSILENIAQSISRNVIKINSEQRKKMHIAAVFVNNFVNHLFTLANKIIEEENINPDILQSLITITFENIMKNNAFDIQTGPAKRNDRETINKHLKILEEYSKNYAEVYKILTESIISTYKT